MSELSEDAIEDGRTQEIERWAVDISCNYLQPSASFHLDANTKVAFINSELISEKNVNENVIIADMHDQNP